MSATRKLLRQQVKAARGNKETPFNNLWFRLQVKIYGFERAWAMHHAGSCNPNKLTNQVKMKAAGK